MSGITRYEGLPGVRALLCKRYLVIRLFRTKNRVIDEFHSVDWGKK